MSHFQPYTAYKEQAGSWIGDLPEHWEVRPLKRVASVFNGATPKSGVPEYWDGDIAWYTPADIPNDKVTTLGVPRRFITIAGVQSCATTVAAAGSILLSTRAPVGSVGITKSPACTNQGCRAVEPAPGVHLEFLAQILYAARCELGMRANGTTFQEISGDSLRSLPVPVPPKREQEIIVGSLRNEMTRIDTLIEKKTRFIELLKEKRQALITHAVTKGLNPVAQMRDSGIEWLGKVPAHWTWVPLKRAIWFQEGPGIMAEDFRDEGVPLLRVAGVQRRWAALTGCNYLDPDKVHKKWRHFQLDEGDLIVSASATTGTVCEVGNEAAGAVPYTGLIRLRPNDDTCKRDYLRAFLISGLFLTQIELLKAGTTLQHYGPTHLAQMGMLVPPPEEQASITSHIERASGKIDALVGMTERSITLLVERRSALITAAVTGKIDLRDTA